MPQYLDILQGVSLDLCEVIRKVLMLLGKRCGSRRLFIEATQKCQMRTGFFVTVILFVA